MFKKLFQDLSGDWSSGLLVKFLAFLFAVEYGILCLALGVDLSATAAAVGALLGLVTSFQWVQSSTRNGASIDVGTQPMQPTVVIVKPAGPCGFLAGLDGKPDLARWIKIASFVVGIAVLHVVLFWIRGQMMNGVGVAGAFFLLCASQEFGTKAFGV